MNNVFIIKPVLGYNLVCYGWLKLGPTGTPNPKDNVPCCPSYQRFFLWTSFSLSYPEKRKGHGLGGQGVKPEGTQMPWDEGRDSIGLSNLPQNTYFTRFCLMGEGVPSIFIISLLHLSVSLPCPVSFLCVCACTYCSVPVLQKRFQKQNVCVPFLIQKTLFLSIMCALYFYFLYPTAYSAPEI